MFWITPDGNYYEGQHVAPGAVACTQRPGDHYNAVINAGVFIDWAWSETDEKTAAKKAIDTAAGEARAAFPSPGTLVDAEYYRAEQQARDYKAAGYSGTVPSCVANWATASGMGAQQAADDIIATADAWYGIIDTVRGIRLSGKAAVDAAADAAAVTGARDAAVAQLAVIRP